MVLNNLNPQSWSHLLVHSAQVDPVAFHVALLQPRHLLGIVREVFQEQVGGRWNSITEVEQKMRSVGGKSMLEPVLKIVLASKKNEKTLPNDTSRQNVDDISFEETKQYQKRLVFGEQEHWNMYKMDFGGYCQT